MLTNKPSILSALGIIINEKNYNEEFIKCNASGASKEKLYELDILPVTATMTVDERTMHPFGMLSGGASLALAECLAGYASHLFCTKNQFPTGLQVSANHIASAKKDEKLFARADLIHKGKKTHVWNVDIANENGKLISSVRVTNMIISS